MILINKGTTNLVVVTLNEKTNRPHPYYLVEFINKQTHQSVTCISEDKSSYPDRYNSLEIIEITDADALLAEVELNPAGFWDYRIYTQDSATNLLPANADEMVETGIAYVVGPADTTYTYTPNTDNAFVYNG